MLCKLSNTTIVGQGFPGDPVAKTPTFPHILGNKLTQKDNADSGVQFITPAGPRQSLLLGQDPDQFL